MSYFEFFCTSTHFQVRRRWEEVHQSGCSKGVPSLLLVLPVERQLFDWGYFHLPHALFLEFHSLENTDRNHRAYTVHLLKMIL